LQRSSSDLRRKEAEAIAKPAKPAKKPAEFSFRILALDLSLSPGIAALEVRGRTPYLIACDSVATSTADTDAVRNYTVETFVAAFIREHRPFDIVVREDFTSGRNKRATQTIFSAWAAADKALAAYGYQAEDLKPALSPPSVKKYVTGSGKAEKYEVAENVRLYLRLPDGYKWRTGYDDSDACAVGLSYLLREGLIDGIGGIAV
jgi:crossover junction endodeoxyribonuclease RuvC